MGTALKKLLTGYIKSEKGWKINLLQKWPEIMGQLADNVRIEKITHDTVTLGVFDSCWMQELYLLSPVIINTINTTIDEPRIKELRFKLVTRKMTEEQKSSAKAKPTKKVTFSRSEQMALGRIKDETLREGLEAFLIRCYRERE